MPKKDQPKKTNKKKAVKLTQFDPEFLLESLSAGRVYTNLQGKTIFANSSAFKLLGEKNSRLWKELRGLVKKTVRYKNDLVEDFPHNQQVIRLLSTYLRSAKPLPLVTIRVTDVTTEWIETRQQEIFEHIANVSAQNVPTLDWLQSLLNKTRILKSINSCSVMLYDPITKTLEMTISSSNIPSKSLKLKMGQGIAGLSAKRKAPVIVFNTAKDKRYTPGSEKKVKPQSLLALPMMVSNKLVGVFIIRDKPNKLFSEQDRNFYSILANRLAITLEHRKLLERLKQEHAKLDTIINNSREGMVLLDGHGRIELANQAFAAIVNMRPEKIKKEKINSLLPELDELLAVGPKGVYKELELGSLDGHPWVGVFATSLQRNSALNTVLTIRDITAERQLEQVKNDFIATATHELRTPLTAVMGYMSMLNQYSETANNLEDKQKNYLKKINLAANNLSNLVEDLLSVLRLDQNATVLKPEPVKLLPVVKEVVHGLEAKIISKNLKVSLPKKNISAFSDINALQRILLNLLDNAVKYTYVGGKVFVEFKEMPLKNNIKILVCDNGVGIPVKDRSRIFDKFARSHNPLSVEAGGTGLGLYIARMLAEKNGGALNIEKSSPQGTVFALTVPMIK